MDIRILDEDKATKKSIICSDRPAEGGACHRYQIIGVPTDEIMDGVFSRINFQKGAVQEAGVNGCTNEDLLIILIDRLEHFQAGPFPCEENQKALIACRKALNALHSRTADRKARNVEGKDER